MGFTQLSDWIMLEGDCATRIKIDGDPQNVEDRVAFIEKTPRVRVDKYKLCIERKGEVGCSVSPQDAWLYGPKGSSDYGLDEDSRKWCDDMLVLLGWS